MLVFSNIFGKFSQLLASWVITDFIVPSQVSNYKLNDISVQCFCWTSIRVCIQNASYYILESLCETPINKRDKGLTLTKSAVTIASSVCVPGNHIAY
jgi:hypothetical protein